MDSSITRRRVLLALGFGAANIATLRHLDRGEARTVGTASTRTPPSSLSNGSSRQPATDPNGAKPGSEIPVVDASAEITDPNHRFDLVIENGRLMDPESGFDTLASLGVSGTRVAAIAAGSGQLLQGATRIDATGRVVSPGFIDILSYSPNNYGEWYKIADGVTTNLGMHGLDDRAADWFAAHRNGSAPLHFGGAYDNATVRPAMGLDPYEPTTSESLGGIIAAATEDLRNGFIGLHMQPEYTPGITAAELLAHADLAAGHDVPLCVHARFSDNLPPGTNLEAVDELVEVARRSGAHVHIEHINSTGGTGVMSEALGRISAGISEGLSLSACTYPYEFWATYLKSARFANWQQKYGISYGDLQVAGTPQRLTEATFAEAYAANRLTAAYAIPAADVIEAMASDFVMIGSDAILEPPHNNHPRSTGCFSRVLGHYVRDLGTIDLMTALTKMTIQPARLVERRAPAMQRKGRLGIGADADITVFDPLTVIDRSTVANPAQRSAGIDWVVVNGTVVKTPDGSDQQEMPGQAIRSDIAST